MVLDIMDIMDMATQLFTPVYTIYHLMVMDMAMVIMEDGRELSSVIL